MKLEKLKAQPKFEKDRHRQKYLRLQELLELLVKFELKDELCGKLNAEIQKINSAEDKHSKLKQLRKSQNKILSSLEKDAKIVTKHHYRNMWLALGLAVFGVPIGIVLSNVLDNTGLMGIGFPFGMFIGVVLGNYMDKKAKAEGRQIDIVMV